MLFYFCISFDCFEKICIQYRTKKYNDVKDYFIIEMFIDLQKNYINIYIVFLIFL